MAHKPKFKDGLPRQLFDAVLTLKNRQECEQFFEDICTINEIGAMAQRLEVAKMLRSGCIYGEIIAKTGASTATISRIKRCLYYGSGGYNTVLERLSEHGGEDVK